MNKILRNLKWGKVILVVAVVCGIIAAYVINSYIPFIPSKRTLFEASKKGNFALVRICMFLGVSCKEKDKKGITPLGYAILNGHKYIVKLLNEKCTIIDDSSNTYVYSSPLTMAVNAKMSDIVELLLEEGENPNIKDTNDVTLFMVAAAEGNQTIIKKFIEYGANIEAKNKIGETAIFCAVKENNYKVIELLVSYGANIELHNNEGFVPLHIAVEKGFYKSVNILIKCRANVNSLSLNNITPIFYAAQNGDIKMLELLVKNGANLNHVDNRGSIPFIGAVFSGKIEAVKYLAKYKPIISSKKLNALIEYSEIKENQEIVKFLEEFKKINKK